MPTFGEQNFHILLDKIVSHLQNHHRSGLLRVHPESKNWFLHIENLRNHHSPEGPEGTREGHGGSWVKSRGRKGASGESDGDLIKHACWSIRSHQYWFICCDACTRVMDGVNNSGDWVQNVWQLYTVFPIFLCL